MKKKRSASTSDFFSSWSETESDVWRNIFAFLLAIAIVVAVLCSGADTSGGHACLYGSKEGKDQEKMTGKALHEYRKLEEKLRDLRQKLPPGSQTETPILEDMVELW